MSISHPNHVERKLSKAELRAKVAWIRDVLDPIVAREGPDALDSNDVLTVNNLLVSLQHNAIDLSTLRTSRIHRAVTLIAGRATRWPGKLIERCDDIIGLWEARFGTLRKISTPLYGRGGRLHRVCKPGDLSTRDLLRRFAKQSPDLVDNKRAFRRGDLGFEAGAWWINSIFAFRDGIIDEKCLKGGICHDKNGPYAILLTGNDELESRSPISFTYRAGAAERGRYRLTSADYRSRHPIRILRSHNLMSLWSPNVGIRYEGLYRVAGWKIKKGEDGIIVYDIDLEREPNQTPMDAVMAHPGSEEEEDYREFHRLRMVAEETSKSRKIAPFSVEGSAQNHGPRTDSEHNSIHEGEPEYQSFWKRFVRAPTNTSNRATSIVWMGEQKTTRASKHRDNGRSYRGSAVSALSHVNAEGHRPVAAEHTAHNGVRRQHSGKLTLANPPPSDAAQRQLQRLRPPTMSTECASRAEQGMISFLRTRSQTIVDWFSKPSRKDVGASKPPESSTAEGQRDRFPAKR